ncbi:MAG TPA: HK97 family phage prohead protease [Alphaproteobacteria bacterium]|nr:HK97 family phage prohead protease [Alphaproteobacteria bacterium]
MTPKTLLQYPLQVKSYNENGFFAGYASIYNKQDFHNDIILNGAFKNVEKSNYNGEIKLLWQHKADEPIGTFTKIIEDAKGLYVEGKLNLNVERAREAYSLLKSGALNGLSVGFIVKEHEYDEEQNIRFISKAELWEISLVTFPANSEAKIKVVKAIGLESDEHELISKLDKIIKNLKQ